MTIGIENFVNDMGNFTGDLSFVYPPWLLAYKNPPKQIPFRWINIGAPKIYRFAINGRSVRLPVSFQGRRIRGNRHIPFWKWNGQRKGSGGTIAFACVRFIYPLVSAQLRRTKPLLPVRCFASKTYIVFSVMRQAWYWHKHYWQHFRQSQMRKNLFQKMK